MTDIQALIACLVASGITILLRALPFLVFSGKKTPKIVQYLSEVLPYAIMGMLVVYCFKDVNFTGGIDGFLPEIIASLVAVLLYSFKKNTILSIVFATAVYMILVQFVF